MLSLPHAAVGAAISSITPFPLLSVPLAFLSHFLTDYVPHWNPHLDTELKKHGSLTKTTQSIITIDFFTTLVFIALLAFNQPTTASALNLSLCALSAIAPDLVEAPHYFLGIKLPFIDKLIHHQRHNQNHVAFLPGMIAQGLIFALCLFIILR